MVFQSSFITQAHRSNPIEIWQAKSDLGNDTVPIGVIGPLFQGLMDFFKTMLARSMNSRQESPLHDLIQLHRQSIERSLAALFFWGCDLDVAPGDLDLALQHSGELRDTVLAVLISIAESTQRKSFVRFH